MLRLPGGSRRIVPIAFAVGLAALYWSALGTSFLNDDYLFLEQARSRPLLASLTRLDALGNYWRPLSRQLYFRGLSAIAGGDPRVFHAFNFAVFLGALALLADLLAAFTGGFALLAGVLFFAVLPFQRVNLIWISCSQDLLALGFSLGAIALWRRERRGLAVAAYVAALASKESALPLPLVLAAWDVGIAKRGWREALGRQRPALLALIAWGVLVLVVRARSHPQAVLEWTPDGLLATFAHLAQTLLGIESPAGFVAAFGSHLPAIVPLVLFVAAGWLAFTPATAASSPSRGDASPPLRFALFWIAVFGFVTWPVVHIWCGYYYTLAAVGAALLVALAARRLDRVGWVVLCAALLWWHAAGTSIRAFAVTNRPWGWTSHLTTWYFSRGATLASSMAKSLRRREPDPPHGTRFFFATLPPYAGFQMGNGALIRTLYRDPSLESWFYSQFGDTTAGDRPCRFDWWDGADIQPLYPGLANPFFQVGCDLLLLDRPRGAAHAFRRSLAAGGTREDDLYWLGWALLWSGDRDGAESAWKDFGARDDSATWRRNFQAVRTTLFDERDTLTARRQLITAIRSGVGLPQPHAILGELLFAKGGVDVKYGLLELQVATWLDPRILFARRELVLGLAGIGMNDRALAELDSLKTRDPGWRADSTLVPLERHLRAGPKQDVATFP